MEESKEQFLVKHAQTKITVEKLDDLFDYAMNPKGLKFAWIIHIIKLISIYLYFYSRKRILEDTWLLSVQRYEIGRINNNRDELEENR